MAREKTSIDNCVPCGTRRRRMCPGAWGHSPPPSLGKQSYLYIHNWLLQSPPYLDVSFWLVPVGIWKVPHGAGSGLKNINVLETLLSQQCCPSSLLPGSRTPRLNLELGASAVGKGFWNSCLGIYMDAGLVVGWSFELSSALFWPINKVSSGNLCRILKKIWHVVFLAHVRMWWWEMLRAFNAPRFSWIWAASRRSAPDKV